MNTLRLSTVALTIVLFTMDALILPVNTAFAHCNSKHEDVLGFPECLASHGGGDPEPTPAFTVKVFLDAGTTDDGDVTVTEVKINGNRQSLNGTMATPALSLLDATMPCGISGVPPALFSISTAKIPPSAQYLTYVEASIYDFTSSTTGDARISLSFVPDSLEPLVALFPTNSGATHATLLTGNFIGVSISPDHGSCSGMINWTWRITVTKD